MINKDIKLVDNEGKSLGYISIKEAKKLINKGKAYFINKKKLCLKKKRGLYKIEIPRYSLSEELISAISHGIGVLLSIAILVLCVVFSAIEHNVYAVVSTSIYAVTSIILYLVSTLYHSFKINKAKRFFRIIDHCSIYLLIAGTYTPYALVTLREASPILGWSVFGVIWGCAVIGIIFTSIDMNKFKTPGMILYLIMGWMILFTFKTLMTNIDIKGIYLMVAAGVTYTIGAIIYGLGKKVKYMHSIFHLFVIIASLLFFFSIFFYVI